MEQKIGPGGKGFLFAVAGLTDALQAFLTWTVILMPLTPFISICAWIAIGLTLAHYGAGPLKARNALRSVATSVAEIVPAINGLPFWTVYVWSSILLHNRRIGAKAV